MPRLNPIDPTHADALAKPMLDAVCDGRNADPKVAAILRFARIVVAIAAFNVFTNPFNNVAATDVDFPHVPACLAAAA